MTENIKGIYDISGYGGGYEEACQTMLQAGYDWMLNHAKGQELKNATNPRIFGVFIPGSNTTKELGDIVAKSVPDCSGAMHHAVMSHLIYISTHGLETWKAEVKKRHQEAKP